MRRYFEHIKTKEPHQRRTHAMQIAGVITALVALGWLATLGVRLAGSSAQDSAALQAASALGGIYTSNNSLEATTSSYSGY